MKRFLSAILLAVPAFSLLACGSSIGGGGVGYSKDEARAKGGVDAQGKDICASEGWYDDGTCDDFCPVDDGDCSVSNQCPSPDDPSVSYVGDYQTCIVALWACGPNQIPFQSPDCGCGCIGVDEPGETCGGFAGIPCKDGFFCNFPDAASCGAADQTGTCEPIPEACPEYYSPVCGCDGVTYANPCFAHGAGVSVASDGECGGGGEVCGGFAGFACGKGEFCNYALDAGCGFADQTGTCAPIPEACPEIYHPVCGCDGVTYSNSCFANGAGTSVASDGPCAPSGEICGGFAGFPCPSGEYCNYPIDASCGYADQTGTCAPIPEGCTEQYDPVCGCDGKTYGNACEAASAGISVAAKGACN